MHRFFSVVVVGCVGTMGTFVLPACGGAVATDSTDGGASSGSSSSSGGSSTSSSSASSSSSSSSSGSTSSSGGTKIPVKDCSNANPNNDTCTPAEKDAYAACYTRQCDAELKQMLGDNYANGELGGACKSVFECYNGCACTDSRCHQKCFDGLANSSCMTALEAYSDCTQRQCPPPACLSGG